jgi:hypothetical protein
MSNNFPLFHEKGLAELSISDKGVVPAGVRKKQNIAIAWNNDDFLEDTTRDPRIVQSLYGAQSGKHGVLLK